MGKVSCDRCRVEVDATQLPTHQYAKFDGEVHYLCGDVRGDGCYGSFLRLVTETDSRRPRHGEVPTHQFVKTSDGVFHHMRDEDWEKFRHWYNAGPRSRGGGLNGAL